MDQEKAKRTFLNAQWRKLVMVNYAVDPKILEPYLTFSTQIDSWNGTCYISLVGFMFVDTRMLRLCIPFHVNFEEINLRFYVKHRHAAGEKRGVVFIKEIVPRPALTLVANLLYRENYETMPIRHLWRENEDSLTVSYGWKKDRWHTLEVTADKTPTDLTEGSEEEFITEHFWGYTKLNDSATSEYEVAHPRWQLYTVRDYNIDVDFNNVYGSDFAWMKDATPVSVYLAEGSEIIVKQGGKIRLTKAVL